MRAKLAHRWDLTVDEAKRLQWELSARVKEVDELPETIRYVAGADVHQVGNDQMQAVVCVLSFPELELVEVSRAIVPVTFPYVPGLLAFRESPAVLKAFEQLRHDPDIALFDAQGRAHPRHFGLACHMGVLLDLPSIGCAKSRLYGQADEVADEEGAMTPLYDPVDGRILGMVVRTKKGSPPIYVSVGHKVSLETAVDFVLQCNRPGQRLPEPLRLAHIHARQRTAEPPKPSKSQGTLF
ncbi:MAG: deoxyribonuclease V [Armatimonadetes bacterium]|nr:deoxyribonuclease V [Armatimonadota bacterium]MCX7967405.1 deoxyribonuclease V [Armatimonadota bacterium]MDW8142638.1 deoxyribonuclease V [Armatimonadota bacterium]